MTYAFVPNFSVPLAPIHADRDRVPFHADPILAAIEGHEEAYAVFLGASQGGPTLRAFEAIETALEVMLGTPCATRFGAFALLRHLRWWIEAEAFHAEDCQPGYSFAKAREADLTLLLGCDGVQRIPVSLPSGRLVSAPVQHFPPQPLTIDAEPVRAPALVRLGRALSSAGEHLAGVLLIGGGCLLIGVSTRL